MYCVILYLLYSTNITGIMGGCIMLVLCIITQLNYKNKCLYKLRLLFQVYYTLDIDTFLDHFYYNSISFYKWNTQSNNKL